ncbi:MAG: hypothetical protein ACRC68_18695, partial [Clostridium sp.]
YIEDNDYGIKWQADYIDLGIVGYNVVTVKKKTLKNKPEYKLRYVVCRNKWLDLTPTDYNFATKTEADKKIYFVAYVFILFNKHIHNYMDMLKMVYNHHQFRNMCVLILSFLLHNINLHHN